MSLSFLAWLSNWRKQQSRKRPVHAIHLPLTLEILEDRLAPAVITVNTNADAGANNTQITLRQAIQLIDGNALPMGQQLFYNSLTPAQKQLVDLGNGGNGPTPDKSASNTIQFDLPAGAGGTITILNSPLPDVARPVIIQGGGKVTIDGGQLDPKKIVDTIIGLDLVAGANGSGIYGLTVQNFWKYGIKIQTNDNQIGGSAANEQNTIQANGANVYISGGNGNTLIGNSILNAKSSPTQDGDGVLIENANKGYNGINNTIGKDADSAQGVITTAANVISGNANINVAINNADSNTVIGNVIGLLADGETKSANTQNIGVKITGNATGNRVGGSRAGERNTISGNAFYGIQVDGVQATGNTIAGNNVGTIKNGTNGGVGNGTGIIFTDKASGNTVKMNRIKFNTAAGVLKNDLVDKQNLVYDPNSIAFNGSGIDDGSNDGPVLTSATVSGNTITIQGTLASTPNTSFLLEFFGNSVEDPSGYGEGEFYLGNATVMTDENGNASFTVTFNAIYGNYVSSTATAPGAFTTAFSNDVAIPSESPNASVSGNVWDDANTNGLLDTGESGVADVSVQLFSTLGNLVASTTTDANGNYNFANLTPGDYYLQFAAPSGYIFTPPYQGDDTISSHADPATGDTEQLSLVAGEEDPFINAGILPTSAQPSTSTVVTSDLDPSAYGTPITFTATVSQTDSMPLGGTVTFMDGDNVLSTVEVDPSANGYQAVFTAWGLSLGDHTITAVYNGDGFHLGSSGTLTQIVEQASAVTTVVSSNNPALPAQSVTFTATVAGEGSTPTGTVTFTAGSTQLGTAPVDDNGNATITTSSLPLGDTDITATYSGDSNYSGSSGSLTQVISQEEAVPSIYLTSSANPAIANQPLTLNAGVSGDYGTPTGTVTFLTGNSVIGTAPVVNGTATLTTSTLPLGDQTITANYSGDATYNSSTETLDQTVAYATPSVYLSSSANPALVNQPLTLNLNVSGDYGAPSGTVTFLNGNNVIGTAAVVNGNATLTTSTLPVGNLNLQAVYSGDATYANTTATMSETVQQGVAYLYLSSNNSSSQAGQTVTFNANVSCESSGGPAPTGTVTFYDGSTPIGTVNINGSGNASLSVSGLSIGDHNISAVYSGDATFGSTSSSMTQTVNANYAYMWLYSSNESSQAGEAVTFTANLNGGNYGTPTGSVNFYDGGTFIGSGVLDGNGNATFTTSSLSVGSHTITAEYDGDNLFGSSSGSMTQTVS